jgi:hypothetical protein
MEWDLKEPESLTQARLMTAAPEFVFEQLKFYGENLSGLPKEDLEKLLLKRQDRLIDLALAQFAGTSSVVSDLYKRTAGGAQNPEDESYQTGLRVACLSNRRLHWSLDLQEFDVDTLMAKGLTPEATALLANPSVPSKILVSLYTKADCFAPVDEVMWLNMVDTSARNERLNADYSNDEGPDLSLLHIHKAIFQFLEMAPVSVRSAYTVVHLLGALDPQHTCWPEAIEHVLQRWRAVEFEWEPWRGHFSHLTLNDEMSCLIAALYGKKSTNVKDGPRYFGSPNDEDIAMRCAFYGGSDELSLDQLKAGFARDKDVFVFAVLKNLYVLLDKEKRAFIESHLFGNWITREYQRRCEQIHRENRYFDKRPVSDWLRNNVPDQPDEVLSVLQKISAQGERTLAWLKNFERLVPWAAAILLAAIYWVTRR